jgi:hypothetical protein
MQPGTELIFSPHGRVIARDDLGELPHLLDDLACIGS